MARSSGENRVAELMNLLGKDYLTEKEASHYCGVSLSQFRARRKDAGIQCLRHMGKKLFRRQDLEDSIERAA